MKRGILIITNIIFVIALSYFVNAADFGGIFLSPLSCPAGYKSTQILGDVDGFKDVYLCYKNPGTGGAPFFGGMYIINPDTGATIDGNPMNGGNKGCPNGYDDINVGKITTPVNGAFGVEGKLTGSDTIPHHELHYCKKDNGIAEYSFDGLNGQNKHWNCRTGNEEKSFDGLICPNDPNIARLFLFISASSERPRGCGDGLEFDELDGLILLCSKIITSSPSEAVVYQPQWLDENDNPIRVGVFGKNVKLRTVTQNIIDNTDLRFDVYKQGSPLPLRSFTVKVTGNSAKTASLLLDDVANKNNPNGGREGDSLVIIGTAIDPSDNEELATSVYSQALYIDKSPDVSITFPTNGQAFEEGGMITITASASDPDSSLNGDRVTKVEFFSNGNKLGEDIDSSNGWSFIWDEAPVGTHSLTAKAIDRYGAIGTSIPITIYVNKCGNNIKDGSEQCDNGANNGVCPKICSSTCTVNNCGTTPGGYCGDGIVQKPNDQGVNEICDWRDQTTCPVNQVCVSTGTEACKLCRDVTQGCEQFNNDLSKCEGNEEIARTSIGYNEVGGTCPSISYKCTVNGNSCKAVKMDDYSKCSNPRFIGCSILNCVASVSSPTECKEGYRTIEITYTQVGVSGGANCPTCKPKETKNIPCGRNVASLPFMGVLQIIGAIVIIGVIYYFVFLRNKRRKKVKSKK